jgi:Domain of Unknown Function (DUF928)
MKIVTALGARDFSQTPFWSARIRLGSLAVSGLSLSLCSLGLLNPAQAGPFDPPPGQGVPGGTVGGGSRTLQCQLPPGQRPRALAPRNQIGWTDRDHPRFWVYLPPHEATRLEFSLYDQNHSGIYQVTLPVAAGSGMQPIDLPIGAPALNPQVTYQIQRYAQGGFWYEALDQMLTLQQAQPDSPMLQAALADLLKAAGLDPMASPLAAQMRPAGAAL